MIKMKLKTMTALAGILGMACVIGMGFPGSPNAQSPETTTAEPSPADVPAPGTQKIGPVTNLPIPRYVSLKSGSGNVRRGPSLSHRIDWVFKHRAMPLRVTAEYSNWRRVEDRDGAGGWIHYALISGVRTVIVNDDMTELLAKPNTNAPVVARAEAGAILHLGECTKDWCELNEDGADGWVQKTAIWGVDPDEIRD
ncbi:hypothetical protein ERN12_08535 [Rhodobacteraceae bacterium]|nr:hypothetical protein ERN12_08535 [Paracoccaceae bacterium]